MLDQRGFTLIEVMVAFVIFIIAIIGCYRLQFTSTLSNSKSNSVATASTWAQYVAEDLLARQYKDNNTTKTDPFLLNSKGDANGLVNVNAVSSATSDGCCRVLSDGSIVWPAGGVNPVPVASDLYSIFWNIVDNRPLNSVKQIRIIVIKNGGMRSGQLYTQDYFKLGPLN
jgi:prepilin-type N-terminal cleavage/methylation domain-containing protein